MSIIKVNGQVQDVEFPITLARVIQVNDVVQPDMVSVQLNGEFVQKDAYSTLALKENDEIDFLYFMGGGSGILKTV
jgi:sulfur carrier protein